MDVWVTVCGVEVLRKEKKMMQGGGNLKEERQDEAHESPAALDELMILRSQPNVCWAWQGQLSGRREGRHTPDSQQGSD